MNQTLIATPLLSWQKNVVSVAWLTYAAYYLGRVNIATAIPDMSHSLALSKGQIGLITTGAIWAYALGTLVNGQLGDRLKLRRFVLMGLIGTGVMNLIFGTLSSWLALFLVWTVNGYFQATGWGPILRILANWLTPPQRRKISGVFGSSFVAGNTFTWLLTGWLVANFGWRMAFLIPGIFLILTGVGWYISIRDLPEEAGFARVNPEQKSPTKTNVGTQASFLPGLIASFRRFWSLIVAAIFLGFIFASLTLWTPTYFTEVGSLGIGAASTMAALLPFAGICGTVLIGWLVGRFFVGKEAHSLTVVLLVLTLLFFFYPALPFNLITNTIALMLIGGITFGATSLLLSTMTMTFGKLEDTSSTAGLLDFSFATGSGFSGIIVGAILSFLTWNTVFFTLSAAALGSAIFVSITIFRFNRPP